MLVARRPRLERHHAVAIADDALKAAIVLTDRFVTDRARPDKAIDVLDEACAHAQAMAHVSPELDTLIREAYALLGLQSFLTVGEDECRAWTIRAGMTAQEAAGVIHSDFVNKFIRAEVVHYDDFIAAEGSFAKAKDAGHWRLEGKNYVVKDGDILNIRHS